ncbi:MAG: fibronectin type III-like domain-contianing protein, partial [Clostridia bacterium]|nr:fibronectin type III-like domain-contianing protein [Clostridia bacterium]
FVYESLTREQDTLEQDGHLQAMLVLRNDSDREGTEVVQAYVHDRHASVTRPTQQLVFFGRVTLAAHQMLTLPIPIEETSLRFWDRRMQYTSEKGEFELFVGHADHPVRTVRFCLK